MERNRVLQVIAAIKERPAFPASGLVATIGPEALDDGSIVPVSGEHDLVLCSDFVRGPGFRLFREGIIDYFDIGYYLVGANVSDLAAMGASPVGLLAVVRYDATMTSGDFSSVMRGIALACQEFSIPLLGGDTGSYESVVLSAAAIGVVPSGKRLLRSAGSPGDVLMLTGAVGRAAAALVYFAHGRPGGLCLQPADETELALSWKRLRPAVLQGQQLLQESLSRCAIDTSDGLASALCSIAEASGLDAIVHRSAVPIDYLVTVVAEAIGLEPLALAVSESVDFRLLFSVSRENIARTQRLFAEHQWDLFEIGELRYAVGSPGAWYGSDRDRVPVRGLDWADLGIA